MHTVTTPPVSWANVSHPLCYRNSTVFNSRIRILFYDLREEKYTKRSSKNDHFKITWADKQHLHHSDISIVSIADDYWQSIGNYSEHWWTKPLQVQTFFPYLLAAFLSHAYNKRFDLVCLSVLHVATTSCAENFLHLLSSFSPLTPFLKNVLFLQTVWRLPSSICQKHPSWTDNKLHANSHASPPPPPV